MLFNSFTFLGAFLPVTLALWWLLKAWAGMRVALAWLVLASLFFYAVWDVRYLAVLLGSVGVNFWLGGKILAARARTDAPRAKRWMVAGVAFNLAVLGLFKYAYFLASNLFGLLDRAAPFEPLLLPLAISFVTFQKIAYLVDCRRGLVQRHDLLDYLFFVSFFPQLIAGPIVHHRPLTAQTRPGANPLFGKPEVLAAGLCLFAIGLFKKVILADSLARYATPVFEQALHAVPTGAQAWQGMLAYTLQLYFDFSAYSDMAIGLALMFGFRLPVNFASPYQASSIIEFWRRWHMTLSRFLRDYLYIPLGGNRHGALQRYRNLLITTLLAGLWHGAGWNFLEWGALHGLLLALNHGWHAVLAAWPTLERAWRRVPQALLVVPTFLLVALAWVLFRAADMSAAAHMYQGLLQPLGEVTLAHLPWHSPAALLESLFGLSQDFAWVWIGIGLLVVLGLPSATRLLAYDPQPNAAWNTRPGFTLGLLSACGLWFAMKWMAVRPATEFLYFNF
ncbi:MAG: MBOAT family O-acyltransferase [Rhodoferax sp.]|uniref:MBOAT family O-acyltransferase n=1 Tax=Rhodoferax sp. TaxID=50421 RepID=UPI003BB0DC42